MSDDSRTLLARYCDGSDAAAEEIFRRYLNRLIALARTRMTRGVARRADPEDAVQSALRSFFVGARADKFELQRSGDLWRLLASITSHKVARLTSHHRAQKRSVRRDVEFPASASVGLDEALADPQPRPDEAALAAEELAELARALSPELRQVLELRLQDTSVEAIAAQLGCSTRTIRRRLDELRALIERRAQRTFSLGEPNEKVPLPANVAEGRTRVDTLEAHCLADPSTIDYRDITIEAHLGSGGMGRVYRARSKTTGALVALKVLRKALLKRPAAVSRFRREAAIVASLDHPGIVRTHGFGRMPGGSEFFVMDLVAGGDLSTLARDSFDERRIAAWLSEAATAVDYANRRGIVHCDLKPSNLLVDAAGHVVVGDFGLASALGPTTVPAGATPAFAAPELMCPTLGRVSPATDVWGLGAVLGWLLWGTTPWNATTVEELRERIDTGRCVALPNVDGATPLRAALAAVCRRALALKPQHRYENGAEFANEILLPRGEGGR